jgi:putative ABC transport system permease protein
MPSNKLFQFLRWFCPDHLVEEIEGDLTQKFEKDVKTFGERRAKRRLLWNTIRFLGQELF